MKLKHGDIAKVVACIHGHEFSIGEEVCIIDFTDTSYLAKGVKTEAQWFVRDNELEPAGYHGELRPEQELYVLATLDDENNVIGFPVGGGSSTKPSIKAHKKLSSAKRSQRHFPGSSIIKMTSWEVVE